LTEAAHPSTRDWVIRIGTPAPVPATEGVAATGGAIGPGARIRCRGWRDGVEAAWCRERGGLGTGVVHAAHVVRVATTLVPRELKAERVVIQTLAAAGLGQGALRER